MTAEVKQAFRDRPHLVDGVAGFVRADNAKWAKLLKEKGIVVEGVK